MTDRELIEKAAKAAGIQLADDIDSSIPSGGLWILGRMGRDEVWNPLEDDGDAFRLMVDLQIDVEMNCNIIVATSPEHHEVDEETGEWGPIVDQSAMRAATRRAIVRAAAAMEAS